MIKVKNHYAGLEQFYNEIEIILKEEIKASSKVEALKGLELSYGFLLDEKSKTLMKQVVKIYQDLAAMEMSDDVSEEHVNQILTHLRIWNGAPIDGMIEFLMSGRDCDTLQLNLENYPHRRESTFDYISEDMMLQCW